MGCEELMLWRPALLNHLYWTSTSPTPNRDPDVMEAKWESIVNHVEVINEHGTSVFPTFAHPPYGRRSKEHALSRTSRGFKNLWAILRQREKANGKASIPGCVYSAVHIHPQFLLSGQ
ncbi:uncharacterized protein LOC117557452 [Xyrichtys novacula]|uniref:Uncharacterized protein LOC117557452 n=1 Tax=Xyrichtys novacula TaxID=13765 RepID=A0AAV1G8N1_XYRNO|nr:uncharacterized protein LOC117557452 [Xyrichtys novacula]